MPQSVPPLGPSVTQSVPQFVPQFVPNSAQLVLQLLPQAVPHLASHLVPLGASISVPVMALITASTLAMEPPCIAIARPGSLHDPSAQGSR